MIFGISAERFAYELYEPNFWQRLGFAFSADDDIVIHKAIERAIGYCPSERLMVRPKSRMIAIMCEDDDGEKFWFHHYKLAFEARGAEFKEEGCAE